MVVQYFVGSHLSGKPDLSYYLTPIVYWPMISASVGIIAACLPTLRPLFKGWSVELFIANMKSTFTLRSTTASSHWDGTGRSKGSRSGDEESLGSSTGGHLYKPGRNENKFETNVEIVPLESVRIHKDETAPGVIMVRKSVNRTDEPL
ncbi:hypothetical protein M7I_1005 [Glarea lozoyensis 74030]|nr:hypothetical protein M7I_1005 [Glarea lozoyensis 74030]